MLTDLEGLRPLQAAWRQLAERRGNAFVTPEWFLCWHRHYGSDTLPFVVALGDGSGGLRGLLPLALLSRGHPRTCLFAGANLGDHFHPVASEDDEVAVAVAAGEALASAPARWSAICLDRAEEGDSSWVGALAEATGVRLRRYQGGAASLPLIELDRYADFEEYLASRSRNLRSQIRRRIRRVSESHTVSLRMTRRPQELDRDLESLFCLHDLRFGERSSLRGERVRAFHRDFAAAALERGWLRLWFLELDGRPVAAEYGWRLGRRYSFFNGGFDPAFQSLSPGMLMRAKAIEAALEEGAEEYDLLLGDEPDKLRYADRSRSVANATLARASRPTRLLVALEHRLRALGRLAPPQARRRLGLERLADRSSLRGRSR